jgi:hypothetical protein
VLPLFCHSFASKQHFQFNGNTVCKDTNTTRRRAKLYAISMSQFQRLIASSQGSKLPLYINYIWYRPVSLCSENYRISIIIPEVPIRMINTGVWRWMPMYCTPQHWMEVSGPIHCLLLLHGRSTPSSHQTAGWVSLKISLDIVEQKNLYVAGSITQLIQPWVSHFTTITAMTRL